jgi:hypothetical protein
VSDGWDGDGWAGDDWSDEETESLPAGRASLHRGERRRAASKARPREREGHRWPAVALVAVALVLVGLGGAIHASGGGGSSTSAAAGTNIFTTTAVPVVGPAGAASSAWYCPGPLPLTAGTSSISLANTGTGAVRATLTTVDGHTPAPAAVELVLPGGQTRTYALPKAEFPTGPVKRGKRAMVAAEGAVSVLVQGGGVGVYETIVHAGLPTTASCQVAPGTSWLIASGSTGHAADVFVSLYDPSSLPAVVDVSCATPTAPGSLPASIAPPQLQGLTLEPGQLQVVDLGRIVQLKPDLAIAVAATTGRVVAGASVQTAIDGTYYSRLETAVAATSTSWSFPLAAAPPGRTPVYWLFNPSSAAPAKVEVAISLGRRDDITTDDVTVPPDSIAVISPQVEGAPASALITSAAGPPVVAVRGDVVTAARSVRAHRHGSAIHIVPATYAPWTMLGATAAGDDWLVPLPAVHAGRGVHEAIYVSNTGTAAVTLRLELLPASAGGAAVATTTVVAQPGATTRISWPVGSTDEAIVVQASGAVTAEMDLYGTASPAGDAAIGVPIG